ncbi:50S ribosomal protein L32 [bacterium Unc6]|nr:50S ribosomal protein L32 [bacterium Unc6]
MALPKRRHSQARRDKSRTHQRVSGLPSTDCPQCGAIRLTHRVCSSCGYYRGRQMVIVKSKKEKK